ncbi:hypothetical protein CVS27_05210 [Arthrobacter glacialis]|uniref:Uncharacterized protein n=2 Tax=Arthrobacter glacialis TaxID=1664 RepID=A0A2S4A0E8_ARTGL|nr:hypothetical protein CVS27_05210 [Arthrobacter glacialis]
MSWAAVIPVVLTCVALVFVPGGLVAVSLGLRGLPAAASAPALTVTISALAAIAFGKLGIDWSPFAMVLAAVAVAGAVWLLRRWCERRGKFAHATAARPSIEAIVVQCLGFAAGAGLLIWQLVRVFGSPGNISQTFDGIFHLNAVRYVLNTGNASSLTLSAMTNGDNPPYFYPAAWHGLVALLVQITGAPISVAVNMLNLVLAALVWTLGCMFLVRTVAGPRPWVVAFGAVLAASFSSFPLLLLDFGVLYPNFLSICLIPLGLAAVAAFFNVGSQPPSNPLARFALAPMISPGIAIAHPNGAMTLLAISVPVVLYAYMQRYILAGHVQTQRREKFLVGALLALGLVFLATLWKYIRPPADAAFWDRYHSPAGAAWEIATNSAMNRPEAWVVSALVLMGLFVAVRDRHQWWLLGCYVLTSFLFVVIAGVGTSYLRSVITGVWYNDSYRLAAILPITALPLAALGFGWLLRCGQSALDRFWNRPGRVLPAPDARARVGVLSGFLVVALLAVGMQGAPINFAVASAARNYAETPNSEVVSSDELALIEQLDDLVPAGATIAVNPWTGAALAFALANRDTTSRHVLSTYPADIEIINNSLRNALTDPTVCPAVEAAGVKYALDFGSKEVHGGRHDFPGLDKLQDSPAAELVAQVGEARLFRITACS